MLLTKIMLLLCWTIDSNTWYLTHLLDSLERAGHRKETITNSSQSREGEQGPHDTMEQISKYNRKNQIISYSFAWFTIPKSLPYTFYCGLREVRFCSLQVTKLDHPLQLSAAPSNRIKQYLYDSWKLLQHILDEYSPFLSSICPKKRSELILRELRGIWSEFVPKREKEIESK